MHVIDLEIRFIAHSDLLATMTRDGGYFKYVTQVKSATRGIVVYIYTCMSIYLFMRLLCYIVCSFTHNYWYLVLSVTCCFTNMKIQKGTIIFRIATNMHWKIHTTFSIIVPCHD